MNELAAPGQDPQSFNEDDKVRLGQWYWLKLEDDGKPIDPYLVCVMHIGSNYVEVKAPNGKGWRIHDTDFPKECTREKNYRGVIDRFVLKHKNEVQRLLLEIKELTHNLGVSPTTGIEQEESTRALSTRNSSEQDMKKYKKALIKAKDKTLPDLFEQVETENKRLATWLGADVLTVKAQLGNMERYVEVVEERIFHVELYAGLS